MTEIVKLKKICSLIKRGITPKYTENDGIMVINQRCIRDGVILYKNARKHDIINKKIPEDKKIIDGDVLINSTGVGTLGRVSQIYPNSEMTVDSHVTIVRANPSDVDLAYFGYYLKLLQPSFEASGEGSTGQTELARERIGEHEIILPLKSEQVKIGKLLSNIDDLIQNNKIMNETFEEMARVIFKSWFVDFDPVHAKAAGNAPAHMDTETAALFPSSFGDDGLPVGWQYKKLEDISDLSWGDLKTTKKSYVETGFDAYSASGKDGKLPHFDFEKLGIVLSAIGANCGNTWLARGKWSCIKNTIRFWSKYDLTPTIFLYHATKGNNFWPIRGSAQPFISQGDARDQKIIVPANGEAISFEKIVGDFYEKISANEHENQTLAKLRNTLLPKLMSGEIHVKDAELKVEAAV